MRTKKFSWILGMTILLFFSGCGSSENGDDKTEGNTPITKTPPTETPSSGTPPSGTPSSGTPSSETPSNETPSSETPSSGGTTPTDETNSSTDDIGEVRGKAVDGYLMKSTVFLDLNQNGELDNGEPQTITDTDGGYVLNLPALLKDNEYYKNGYAPLVVKGGIDTGSAKRFRGQLKAPLNLKNLPTESINITPVTTIWADTVKSNIGTPLGLSITNIDSIISGAKSTVASKLGIEAFLLGLDPIAEAKKGNKELLKMALQIHKSIELAVNGIVDLSKTGGEDKAYFSVYESFSRTLVESENDANLSNVFETLVESKLNLIIDSTKDKSLVKKQIEVLNSTTNSLEIFQTGVDFNSTSIIKLSMQIERVIEYVSVKKFIFEIINLDYQAMYNELLLLLYLQDADQYTQEERKKIFGDIVDNSDGGNIAGGNIAGGNSDINVTLSDTIIKTIHKYLYWNEGYCIKTYLLNRTSESIIWEENLTINGKIIFYKDFNLTNLVENSYNNTTSFTASGLNWNKIILPRKDIVSEYCVYNDFDYNPIDANETSGKFDIIREETASWKNGICENVEVKNISNFPINWTINEFLFKDNSYKLYYIENVYYKDELGKLKEVEDPNPYRALNQNKSYFFKYCASSNPENSPVVQPSSSKCKTWGGDNPGYCTTIDLTNKHNTTIKDWLLSEFKTDGYMFNVWNAESLFVAENKVSLKGSLTNKDIGAWDKTTFGICSSAKPSTISSATPNVDFSHTTRNDECVEIVVKNNHNEAVKWRYDLNSSKKIKYAENVTMKKNQDGSYTFMGIGCNQVLTPSETTTIKYCYQNTRLTKLAIGDSEASVDQNGNFGTIIKKKVVANNFTDVVSSISNLYDVSLTVKNSADIKDGDKNIKVALIFNRKNQSVEDNIDNRLLVIVPLSMSKSGNDVTITIVPNSKITLFTKKSDGVIISAEIMNRDENIKQLTTADGEVQFKIRAGSILNKFANHTDVSSHIKDILLENLTTAHDYNTYIAFSDNTFDIDSPILLKDSGYIIDLPLFIGTYNDTDVGQKILSLMGTGKITGYVGIIKIVD